MKEYVLGVSYGHHESSLCLLSNQDDIIYLREEWLSRVKGDHRFPIFSIDYIKSAIPNFEGSLKAVCLFEKPLKNWLLSGLEKNLSKNNYLAKIRQFKESDIFFEKEVKKNLSGSFDIFYCPHHVSHALTSSMFFGEKKRKTIHVILDGYGDGKSGSILYGKDNNLREIVSFGKNSSLGLVYSAITEWANFVPNEDEYKVMALAAFGKPVYSNYILDNIFNFSASGNGDIWVNQDFFNFNDLGLPTIKKKFLDIFKMSSLKKSKNELFSENKHLCDVICSFQNALEVVVCDLINFYINKLDKNATVLLGGGLFHNSRLVGVLGLEIKNIISVSPTPGDAGSSIGAAHFAALCLNFKKMRALSPFLGPKLESLKSYSELFKPITSKSETLDFLLQLLKSNQIFATFQGFAEVGPRALGARSLCCNAMSKKALTHLNKIIKQREGFRPLAPMMKIEDAKKVFTTDAKSLSSSYWMGQILWPKKTVKRKFPFLHKDSSARVQIIDMKDKKFLKGIPKVLVSCLNKGVVLANTSFNIAGDPMVFSVEDCYINCQRLGIEYVLADDIIYRTIL